MANSDLKSKPVEFTPDAKATERIEEFTETIVDLIMLECAKHNYTGKEVYIAACFLLARIKSSLGPAVIKEYDRTFAISLQTDKTGLA